SGGKNRPRVTPLAALCSGDDGWLRHGALLADTLLCASDLSGFRCGGGICEFGDQRCAYRISENESRVPPPYRQGERYLPGRHLLIHQGACTVTASLSTRERNTAYTVDDGARAAAPLNVVHVVLTMDVGGL